MRAHREIGCRGAVHEPSSAASLVWVGAPRRISTTPRRPFKKTVALDVHHFKESIGGRVYVIEVSAVAKDRWRAYIVRVPGVPTALMPFYGLTPTDAARQLSDWLTRAHARAAGPPST